MPGGLRGLQNRCAAITSWQVGSIPTHSRKTEKGSIEQQSLFLFNALLVMVETADEPNKRFFPCHVFGMGLEVGTTIRFKPYCKCNDSQVQL